MTLDHSVHASPIFSAHDMDSDDATAHKVPLGQEIPTQKDKTPTQTQGKLASEREKQVAHPFTNPSKNANKDFHPG